MYTGLESEYRISDIQSDIGYTACVLLEVSLSAKLKPLSIKLLCNLVFLTMKKELCMN